MISKPLYKKVYVWIFALSIISIIVGLALTTAITFIPTVDPFDEGYSSYIRLIQQRLPALSTLSQNIGIALFSVATFLGAILDKTLSGDVKKGMVIASGIGIVALILSRMVVILGYGYP